jgi:hypothetical protein
MTIEEIKALDNRDLDKAIHRAMGWTNYYDPALCSTRFDDCRIVESNLTPEQFFVYVTQIVNEAAVPTNNSEFFSAGIKFLLDLGIPAPHVKSTSAVAMALKTTPRQRAEILLWVLTQKTEAES